MSDDIAALYKAHAGKGVSTRLSDTFLDDFVVPGHLLDALDAFDKAAGAGHTKAALCRALRATPDIIGWYMADLLERYELTRKPGRPNTPVYNRSEADRALHMARQDMLARLARKRSKGALVKAGAAKAAASEAAAAWNAWATPKVSVRALLALHRGGYGPERARRKKLPPNK
jgi:hypothetical protein